MVSVEDCLISFTVEVGIVGVVESELSEGAGVGSISTTKSTHFFFPRLPFSVEGEVFDGKDETASNGWDTTNRLWEVDDDGELTG